MRPILQIYVYELNHRFAIFDIFIMEGNCIAMVGKSMNNIQFMSLPEYAKNFPFLVSALSIIHEIVFSNDMRGRPSEAASLIWSCAHGQPVESGCR